MSYDLVLSQVCSRIQDQFDSPLYPIWESCRDYSLQHPGSFETEEGPCLLFLDEVAELYHLQGREIDQLYWLYQSVKLDVFSRPPNG
jgi:hypothetical protein